MPAADARIDAIRRFNRFYTRQIGVVQDRLLDSPYSLTEARVLYELSQQDESTASQIGEALGLDAGYLSRILRRFQTQGLLTRRRSTTDGRQSVLRLTETGHKLVASLNARSQQAIAGLLDPLPDPDQARLMEAMDTITTVLNGSTPAPSPAFRIRQHQAGDLAWMVHRHMVHYDRAYGWGTRFEALVTAIAYRFLSEYDAERERCWIAELAGDQDGDPRVGSVFVARESDTVARLRMLLVEPRARGLGIGRRLVQECISFASAVGYESMVLSTVSILTPARRLYEQAGFRVTHTMPEQNFGEGLTEETWTLAL